MRYIFIFQYIPDKGVQEYLQREDIYNTSRSSNNNNNNNICLMLYDEIIDTMDEYDLELR